MDQFEMQKEMRKAMNARMSLMMGSIMLIFTAVTSTLMYGMNLFVIASEAAKGTAEYADVLAQVDMSVTMAQVVAVCFLLLGAVEIFSGVCGVRFCNRVDKSAFTLKIVIILLAAELLMQVVLVVTRMLSVGMLVTAVVIPLFMLWGALRLRKMAKADPERVFAIETKKDKERAYAQAAKPSSNKSLRERALMQAKWSPEDEIEVEDEAVPEDEAGSEAETEDETVPEDEDSSESEAEAEDHVIR